MNLSVRSSVVISEKLTALLHHPFSSRSKTLTEKNTFKCRLILVLSKFNLQNYALNLQMLLSVRLLLFEPK